MLFPQVYRRVIDLWEQDYNKSEISQVTGIRYSTVVECINFYKAHQEQVYSGASLILQRLISEVEGDYHRLHLAYAYILGMYLGDGNITKVRKVYRLRVTLDARYPNIIEHCKSELQVLFPNNKIGIVKHYFREKLSYVDVSAFYKYWTQLLPQHGEGMKHERKIELMDWQQRIIFAFPLEFFRGLYHSDGSRFINRVNVGGKDYEYARYQFTNASEDIIQLFCDTCDRLGLHWTRKLRRARAATHVDNYDIYISKRKDVEYLDSVIGAKS